MIKKAIVIGSLLTLAGCASTPPDWLAGTRECRQIGCGEGLNFYPNERGAAQRHARDMYGFEWGQTSSAHHPSTEEYRRLRAQEIRKGNTPSHWNQNH